MAASVTLPFVAAASGNDVDDRLIKQSLRLSVKVVGVPFVQRSSVVD
jgi:hypothetical protein